MAGGVLVEQRVVEDGAELADPALAVDERDLAEPGGARRRVSTIVRIASAPSSASIWTARPPSKRTRRPAHDGAVASTSGLVDGRGRRRARGSGEVNTSSVGRFGMCSMPSTVSKRAACQRDSAAGRSSGRCPALVVERVEARSVRRAAADDERVGARAPGGDRVVLVEPAARAAICSSSRRQRLLDRGRGREDEPRPGRRRRRDDRPVGRAVVDDLADSLTDGQRSRPARTGSRSSSRPGADGPRHADRARPLARRARARGRRTTAGRSRASPRARARSARA